MSETGRAMLLAVAIAAASAAPAAASNLLQSLMGMAGGGGGGSSLLGSLASGLLGGSERPAYAMPGYAPAPSYVYYPPPGPTPIAYPPSPAARKAARNEACRPTQWRSGDGQIFVGTACFGADGWHLY
jgi:hypothetical protein